VRTARDCLSQSVSCPSTRAADVHCSLQKRSSVTVPEMSSRARHTSLAMGWGPRLLWGGTAGSAISGGDSSPRMRPRMRANG
jgi:hypothetical protein